MFPSFSAPSLGPKDTHNTMLALPVVTLTLNPAVDISVAVDRLVPQHKLRCSDERRDAGGGGINVARALRRLGSDVTAIYPAGGSTGDVLDGLVAAEDVRRKIIPIRGQTREDFTAHEKTTGLEYRFVLPGPTLSDVELALCCDLLAAQVRRGGYVVASGSLPPGTPADFYVRVAEVVAARGAKFVLDAAGEALRSAVGHGVYLIKPSWRELGDLVGRSLETEEACLLEARRLVENGAVKYVALTMGEGGAVLVGEGCLLRAAAPKVDVQSSVGAGDSFLAGLIHVLARGRPPEEALRMGVAAGSAALLHKGTGLCDAADVLRLVTSVKVERIARQRATV